MESGAVYCCVKSFVRDVRLQQEPVLCLRPEQLLRLATPFPTNIVEQRPLTEREMGDVVQLSRLCKGKYEMPRAAAALQVYARSREYSVPALTWLQRPGLATTNVFCFKSYRFLFRYACYAQEAQLDNKQFACTAWL